MAEENPKPPLEWMAHLYGAGQWERLEQMAREALAVDPRDEDAHFYRAWALLKLDRAREMRPHVEFLLAQDAESVQHLQLAAWWHMEEKRWKQAKVHLDAALKLLPEEATLWHMAASLEARQNHLKLARQYSARARQLAPDDADIAHLDVALASVGRTSSAEAWTTVREYERALALDPENDSLMGSMGDVYLEELEMPERAEELYRQALLLDPTNRDYQKRLWRAMQARNLLFRTLRLPISGLRMVGLICRGLMVKPWLAFVFLIGFKFVAIFLIWLLLAAIIFAPPAWIVEWLVLADIQRASRAAEKLGGWWLRFHRLPFALRLICGVALILAFWWAIFAWFGISAPVGFIFILAFFVLNLAMLAVRIAFRRQSAQQGYHGAASYPGGTRTMSQPPPLPRASGPQPPPLPRTP